MTDRSAPLAWSVKKGRIKDEMAGRKTIKKIMRAPAFLNEPREYNKSFSRGLRVDLGNVAILFISGTASVDEKGKSFLPGDFRGQVKRTFDNITALLKSEKATWHDVVKTGCYLKDMKYYDEFNRFRNCFYKKEKLNPFPASTCVEAGLCRSELLVEIEAMAILKDVKR